MEDHNKPTDQQGQVQCEVTGAWVAEDEIVVFQGRRVCAQGKAELLERLKSGEKMPGEFEKPTALRRFACMFVDGLILGGINILLMLVFFGSIVASNSGALGTTGYSLYQLILIAFILAYYTYMHGTRGQTLGKMAGKVKVVNGDGTQITMQTAFLRIIYLYLPSFLGSVVVMGGTSLGLESVIATGTVIGGIGSFYMLAGVIAALLDRDQQRAIHDRLAKTRVIALG